MPSYIINIHCSPMFYLTETCPKGHLKGSASETLIYILVHNTHIERNYLL